MICIARKEKCCGCESCVQACPQKCISFDEDGEGFRYPRVDMEKCVNCGLCENVCPVLHRRKKFLPTIVYAAKNPDELVRSSSSSGGVFSLLAELVIKKGGVVFGARFDEKWNVVHSYAETAEDMVAFRTSKYVQSRIGDSFKICKNFLDDGREVLFSGTSCQIAGLKRFLRKDYDNLLTVDVICHGVPSPKVWREYLSEIKENALEGVKNSVSSSLIPPISERDALSRWDRAEIKGISFRDKRTGWKKYSFALTLAKPSGDGKQNTVLLSHIHREDAYMMAFIRNLILRPSCHHCPAKGGQSGADISLADFWNIEQLMPNINDDKGVSMVMIHSEKGRQAFCNLDIQQFRIDVNDMWAICPTYYKSPLRHPNRKFFFNDLNTTSSAISPLLNQYAQETILLRFFKLANRIKTKLWKMTGFYMQ